MLTFSALPIAAALALQPPAEAAPDPPANWAFKQDDRPIKVMIIAGSIGAYQKQPFSAEVARLCKNVEVKNLSKTGAGAFALKQVFKKQVLKNRRLDPEANEHWIIFAAGLNSIASPRTTNWHIRNIFVLAHVNKIKVVALSPQPWGDDKDKRFRGINGLKYLRATQHVVDYMMGNLAPADAFGSHAVKRPNGGATGAWSDLEIADVKVNLFDSPLRDSDAKLRDIEDMRSQLHRDRDWQKDHRGLDDDAKALELEVDANAAAALPRWYLRKELRAFDHLHPNQGGHAIIGGVMCPQLPENWGCECEPLGDK